jgi:hypothetical protein
MSIDLPK